MELVSQSLKGIYRDRLFCSDGSLAHDSGWVANTIVSNCRVLLARLMMNDLLGGIRYLAVGQGSDAWDTEGTPAPDPGSVTGLTSPYAVTVPDAASGSTLEFAYLGSSDAVVHTPTSRLQITITLVPGYPSPVSPATVYPLREFGLFGGSTEETYMINCVRHPVIHKHVSATLVREIRLYF
jgi:hypothetical protein